MAAAKLILLPIVLAPALRMTRRRILMRDSSSVTWFKAGDRVRRLRKRHVAQTPGPAREDRHRRRRVGEMRRRPHCCCAELAEEAAAVTVDLDPPDARQYYFAENARKTAGARRRRPRPPPPPRLRRRSSSRCSRRSRDEILHWHPCSRWSHKVVAVANGNKLMRKRRRDDRAGLCRPRSAGPTFVPSIRRIHGGTKPVFANHSPASIYSGA